jgi:hypothetical protein
MVCLLKAMIPERGFLLMREAEAQEQDELTISTLIEQNLKSFGHVRQLVVCGIR